MKVAGYELDPKLLLHDVEQWEKKVDYVTLGHSHAFRLISKPAGTEPQHHLIIVHTRRIANAGGLHMLSDQWAIIQWWLLHHNDTQDSLVRFCKVTTKIQFQHADTITGHQHRNLLHRWKLFKTIKTHVINISQTLVDRFKFQQERNSCSTEIHQPH
jgi:hypothetical protein